MQTDNPLLKRAEFIPSAQPMTVQGAINKTMFLSGMALVSAAVIFFISMINPGLAGMCSLAGMIGTLVLALLMAFNMERARTLAIPYALFEGLFLGGVSSYYSMRYPGLPLVAISTTFITAFGLLGLYKANIIRATETFRSVVISASLAIAALFLVQILMQVLFHGSVPFLFNNGIIGIAFAGFVAVIASLNLILDFDMIERSAQMRAPQSFEWYCGVALLATLVWMYISILRLLGLVRSN